MALIDIGSEAINRAASYPATYTMIDLANPANNDGIITSIEVWAAVNITGLRVGTFYLVSGTTFKCRDSVIIGNVTAGSKQTFSSLSIAVEIGDLIGCYFTAGSIEASASGYSGVMFVAGEYIDPGDSAVYALAADDAFSLYGIGISVAISQDAFVEIRDSSGNLVSVLENVHAISYEHSLNKLGTMSFELPADDPKGQYLLPEHELWLYHLGELIDVYKLKRMASSRD